ncbi:MAG: hypothetical protein NTX50_20355, partial [Candidatus Sumerlaeota bacterium]|nr:hypothetical protein [Candidatus Sumerlaeota bacterium]
MTVALDYPFTKEDYPYYIIWKYENDNYAEFHSGEEPRSLRNIKYVNAPYPFYSHLSFAFAASFVCHCILEGLSAPSRFKGV